MRTVHANKLSDFLSKAVAAGGCCRCDKAIDHRQSSWCSIAQVTNSLAVVGGALCEACHAAFGVWMREGEEGPADP